MQEDTIVGALMMTKEIINLKNRISLGPENREDIGFASIYYLPFRFEIGKIIKYNCSFGKNIIDIWIYNEVSSDLPDSQSFLEAIKPLDSGLNRLTSKLLIHFKNPTIENEDFTKIVECVKTNQTQSEIEETYTYLVAISALDRLMIACNGASPHMFSGRMYEKIPIEELFNEFLHSEYIIISPKGSSLSTKQAETILSSVPTRRQRLDSWTRSVQMENDEVIQDVQEILTKYLDRMLLYELLFEANCKARAQDWRSAFIQMAMAFESAIWLILDFEFRKKILKVKDSLTDDTEKKILTEKYIETSINKFGMNLGVTLLTTTLPFLFFDGDEILKPNEIKDAIKAISIRNKLVHSKKTKGGDYHWSVYGSKDLTESYRTLNKLTLKLAGLIRKRIDELPEKKEEN